MKVYDYLSCDSPYQKGDHVEGLIYEILDSFGAFVAVDNQYSALIPHNEMTRELHIGDVVRARIKEVTEEGKLTLSLQEKTKVQMGKDAELQNQQSRLQTSHRPAVKGRKNQTDR